MPKLKYFIGSMLVVAALASCSKDDSYDIKGEQQVKFFTNNMGLGNAPENSISYNVVNIPDAAGTGIVNLSSTFGTAVKFPVLATKPVSQDVTIGAVLDNTLIDKYNAEHNTNYAPFPAGFLTVDGLSAKIPKGATSSSDSFTIATNAAALNTLTGKSYMAPIKLTTVSNPAAGEISSNATIQVTYIVANVEQRLIKYLAVAADAVGTLQTRTSWTATFTPAAATIGGTGSVLDGSTTSYSRFGVSPVQLDVNMQAAKNVTGIRLYTSNNATYIPTQVEVYLSNDGIGYDLVGSPLKANLTYASSYNYILFYKAIAAKYVRLKLYYSTSTNTQNTRVTEFDVYAN